MATRFPLILAAAVVLVPMSACKPQPEVVDTSAPDPNADALRNAAPVKLPPSIKSDATYRCKDTSLVHVTFFDDDKQATVIAPAEKGEPVKLTAENAGDELKAEGYAVKGDAKNITITLPGKGSQTCKGPGAS